MKFNIFFKNEVLASKDALKSPEFQKSWTEKEISALFLHFGDSCKIVHLKNTKKADTP